MESASKITFCEAIARMEGWLIPASRCRRNNNPGNLNYASWEISFGAKLEDGPNARFAVFPSAFMGFSAMSHLLVNHYAGLSLRQALAKWAPASENDTAAYLANVSRWTGIDPDAILTADMLQPPQNL